MIFRIIVAPLLGLLSWWGFTFLPGVWEELGFHPLALLIAFVNTVVAFLAIAIAIFGEDIF